MGLGLKGGMGPSARLAVKERLRLGLGLRLVVFGNDCHLPAGPGGGRFCSGNAQEGGLSDKQWAVHKAVLLVEREKYKARGTVIEPAAEYTGEPVHGPPRAGWITEAELDSRTTRYEYPPRSGKMKTASLRQYIRDTLKGYAVEIIVRGEKQYLSPVSSETAHSVYRAFQYELADVLFAKGPDGRMIAASMVEDVMPLSLEQRVGNPELTRIYAFRASRDFVISAVVAPKTGKLITVGVEFPEGKLITRADVEELRSRTEKWKRDLGLPIRTRLIDVGKKAKA